MFCSGMCWNTDFFGFYRLTVIPVPTARLRAVSKMIVGRQTARGIIRINLLRQEQRVCSPRFQPGDEIQLQIGFLITVSSLP